VAGRARLGEARGERTGQAATNAILYGSCDAQPVQVTIGVQGGWIQATIRDQGRPPSRTAPLMSLRGRGLWLIGAVGRRVAPCQGPPRDAGAPSPVHISRRLRRLGELRDGRVGINE